VSQAPAQSIHDIELPSLNGRQVALSEYSGKVVLAVNVASRCGFTPQYKGLQALQDRYADRGFTVLGFPCNQFFNQEPGNADQIQQFCSQNYAVTFPLFAKLDVKGSNQHPLYAILSELPDDQGKAGSVKWNFEKFLVAKTVASCAAFGRRSGPKTPRSSRRSRRCSKS